MVFKGDGLPVAVIVGNDSGFTVIVKVIAAPLQAAPALVGVTVTVAITGLAPLFIAINAGISPVPLAARPIPGVSFTQL